MKIFFTIFSILSIFLAAQSAFSAPNCSGTDIGKKIYKPILTDKISSEDLVSRYQKGCAIDYFVFPNGLKLYLKEPVGTQFSFRYGLVGERVNQVLFVSFDRLLDAEVNAVVLKERYGNLDLAAVLAIHDLDGGSQYGPGARHFALTETGYLLYALGRGDGSPVAHISGSYKPLKLEKYKIIATKYVTGEEQSLLVKFATDLNIYQYNIGGVDPYIRNDLTETDLN
jgi:hypothetical protein